MAHLSTPDPEYAEVVKSFPSTDRAQSHDVAVARKGLELLDVTLKEVLRPQLPKGEHCNR